MTDPWDEQYIYLHENHQKSTIHVGKYTSPMDAMGYNHSTSSIVHSFNPLQTNIILTFDSTSRSSTVSSNNSQPTPTWNSKSHDSSTSFFLKEINAHYLKDLATGTGWLVVEPTPLKKILDRQNGNNLPPTFRG